MKHYKIVPATGGLDIAIFGPGVYEVFPPEMKKTLKSVLKLLDAAHEAGLNESKSDEERT